MANKEIINQSETYNRTDYIFAVKTVFNHNTFDVIIGEDALKGTYKISDIFSFKDKVGHKPTYKESREI